MIESIPLFTLSRLAWCSVY